MPPRSKATADTHDDPCSIRRTLGVLSDSWTFLIVREAMFGRTTFAQFRDALGISTDVLTDRLADLVDAGVLCRSPYREPGQRTRYAYELTPAGDELKLVLVAMQQWGRNHVPTTASPTVEIVTDDTAESVRAVLRSDDGRLVPTDRAHFVPVDGRDRHGG